MDPRQPMKYAPAQEPEVIVVLEGRRVDALTRWHDGGCLAFTEESNWRESQTWQECSRIRNTSLKLPCGQLLLCWLTGWLQVVVRKAYSMRVFRAVFHGVSMDTLKYCWGQHALPLYISLPPWKPHAMRAWHGGHGKARLRRYLNHLNFEKSHHKMMNGFVLVNCFNPVHLISWCLTRRTIHQEKLMLGY
jgi:hypothetical protein